MAATQEIPRSEWNAFFARFSDEHDDMAVALEVLGTEIGAQVEGRELHLRGITPSGGRDGDDIALLFDSPDGTHLTHMIAKPAHVWVTGGSPSPTDALEIESSDGTKTLLRFDTRDVERESDAPPIERFPRKGDDEDLT